MAIALITSQHDTSAAGASATKSFTPGGAANFLVVKIIQYDDAGNISGITFNGVAMTYKADDGIDGSSGLHPRVAIYTLVNPATGAANIVVSFSPNNAFGFDIITEAWSGVDTTTPVGNVNGKYKESGSVTSPYTTILTIGAGNYASDAIYINAASITPGGSQTAEYNGLDFGGTIRCGASYKGPGASSDMSWSYTGSPTTGAIAAIEIKAGGTSTTPLTFSGTDSLAGGELL